MPVTILLRCAAACKSTFAHMTFYHTNVEEPINLRRRKRDVRIYFTYFTK